MQDSSEGAGKAQGTEADVTSQQPPPLRHLVHSTTSPTEENAVNGWVQRVMLGSVSILITLLLGFITWSIPTLNEINTDTKLLSASQAWSSNEVSRLSANTENLQISIHKLTEQSHTWATREQVQLTRDQMMEKITAMEAQLNDLKLRVALMESGGRAGAL